jgi:hypothetical protein
MPGGSNTERHSSSLTRIDPCQSERPVLSASSIAPTSSTEEEREVVVPRHGGGDGDDARRSSVGAEESGISLPAEVGVLSPEMSAGAVQRVAARSLVGARGWRRELGFKRGSRGGRRAETV